MFALAAWAEENELDASTALRAARATEQESREQLERTVDDYLAFTQRVEQGDLSQRLRVQQDGALGQLTHE